LVAGDKLVPVPAGHVVDAALGGLGVRVARARGRVRLGAHVYDLLSSGGGTLVPRYSTGMPPSGESLRCGCPSQSSGISILVSAGCPSKMIPKKSQVSRSCQLAAGYTGVTDGRCGSASGVRTSRRRRRLWVIEVRWYTALSSRP